MFDSDLFRKRCSNFIRITVGIFDKSFNLPICYILFATNKSNKNPSSLPYANDIRLALIDGQQILRFTFSRSMKS